MIKAILQKPKVLLLDEPASGLEPEYSKNLYNLIKIELPSTTVIFIENVSTDVERAIEGNINADRKEKAESVVSAGVPIVSAFNRRSATTIAAMCL